MFQGLLFDDDREARSQDLAQRIALERAQAEAEARKAAWDAGKPFPDDAAKWAAAHRDLIAARCREAYSEHSEWHLLSTARNRAGVLGCKIGRRAPMLAIYRRAAGGELIPCYWCKHLTVRGERHVDHIQPLATGGEHVAGNLCIACIDCNLSKGDENPKTFRQKVAAKRAINDQFLREYFAKRKADASPSSIS